MFMALAVATDVLSTRTGRVTFVTGETIRSDMTISSKHYPPRQLLLCRVALGKSFFQFSAMKMAHAPPGHHSVVGRPSVGGLSFPEYVIYRGEQVTKHNANVVSKREYVHFRPTLNIWSAILLSNLNQKQMMKFPLIHLELSPRLFLFVCDKIY